MNERVGASLGNTLRDKVQQEEVYHLSNRKEEQLRERWLREEERSGVSTMEM